MSVDLKVVGADHLAALARDLKREAGGTQFRKDLIRGMRHAGEPMKAAAKEAARERLPKTGGLNEFVANSTFSIRTRTTQHVSVRLVGTKKGHDLKATDAGRIRHPVFGRWVAGQPPQLIPPGWFSDAPQLSDAKILDPLRRDLIRVMDEVARRVA